MPMDADTYHLEMITVKKTVESSSALHQIPPPPCDISCITSRIPGVRRNVLSPVTFFKSVYLILLHILPHLLDGHTMEP